MDSALSNTSTIPTSEILVGPTDTAITSQGSSPELEADGGLGLAVETENWVSLKFAHSGKEYDVNLADSDRCVQSSLAQRQLLTW